MLSRFRDMPVIIEKVVELNASPLAEDAWLWDDDTEILWDDDTTIIQ